MSDQDQAQMLAFDVAFALDDEMQKEIETSKADPFEITTPSKDGFLPSELTPWAQDPNSKYFEEVPEEHMDEAEANWHDGKRERWVNRERCEIISTGYSHLKNRDTQEVEGIVAYVEFKVQGGPNDGKTVSQRWYVRKTERKRARQMNSQLQELFSKLKMEPVVIDLPTGGQAPSFTASLAAEIVKGRVVEVPIQQKWDWKWVTPDDGETFAPVLDEPKQFKKKILFDGIEVL